MHKTSLRKVGGSVMLAVPPALLDILRLRPGAKVGITVESGRLVVEPQQKPAIRWRRFSLNATLKRRAPSKIGNGSIANLWAPRSSDEAK